MKHVNGITALLKLILGSNLLQSGRLEERPAQAHANSPITSIATDLSLIMDATSPPLTPSRRHATPIDTTSASPSHSYHDQLRRRASSFSSNHDRSPATPVNKHRFSNASQLSGEFGTPIDDRGGGGLGNLADELDQLDDEEYEEGETLATLNEDDNLDQEEVSRDSGIDVSYKDSKNRSPSQAKNFSKPFCGRGEKPPDQGQEDAEDRFSHDLEDLMNSIARMTSYTSTSDDPLVPRAIAQMQDLGNQTSLEAAAQRLTTSTNSMTTYMTNQSKAMQTLMQSLYPMFAFSAPLDLDIIEETLPLIEALATGMPQPDIQPVQRLQRLDHENGDVIHALSQLTDTLQMGKQITNAAARHLRSTQTMVLELRHESERAELARHELVKSDWEERLHQRWCASECKDIINGFEDQCSALRGSLEEAAKAGA